VKTAKNAGKPSMPNKKKDETFISDEIGKKIEKLLPFRHRIKKRSVEIRFADPEELEDFLSFLSDRKE